MLQAKKDLFLDVLANEQVGLITYKVELEYPNDPEQRGAHSNYFFDKLNNFFGVGADNTPFNFVRKEVIDILMCLRPQKQTKATQKPFFN